MSEESIDELFAASLAGDREDAAAWDSVKKLHFIGSEEVLDKAVELTQSVDPGARARGADVLGQLGVGPLHHSTSFINQRLEALLALLKDESDSLVLNAAIVALGHMGEADGKQAIVRFSNHPNESVRYAVAFSLPSGPGEDAEVLQTLMQLMNDSDSDVRDWATFGLGSQIEADSAEIREALFAHLEDPDYDTRAEATIGLAKRQDLRSLPVILEELNRDEYGAVFEEAAEYLLGLDADPPEGWETWRYIEALQARFNLVAADPGQPSQ